MKAIREIIPTTEVRNIPEKATLTCSARSVPLLQHFRDTVREFEKLRVDSRSLLNMRWKAARGLVLQETTGKCLAAGDWTWSARFVPLSQRYRGFLQLSIDSRVAKLDWHAWGRATPGRKTASTSSRTNLTYNWIQLRTIDTKKDAPALLPTDKNPEMP